MYPNRCDNEAFIQERIDMTNMNAWLAKQNEKNPEYAYKMFQVFLTATLKTITLRPKMNRFIANKNLYQRNEVSAAFTIKKQFSDKSEEALAFIHAKDDDTIHTIHDEMYRQISSVRDEGKDDQSTENMNFVAKLPRFLIKFVGVVVRFLDRHGWMPQSVVATDPYQSSCVLSNVGSIHVKSGYHHMTNWGTTSVFILIGEMKNRPVWDDEGNMKMIPALDFGMTIDERVADGYYYSKTVRLLKHLLENPELLELPLNEKVEY